jgi:hypothetical protein
MVATDKVFFLSLIAWPLVGCVYSGPECPIALDSERVAAARLMPAQTAEEIITWNTSAEWAEHPYFLPKNAFQGRSEPASNRTQYDYYDLEMWLYHGTKCNCVMVGDLDYRNKSNEREICAADRQGRDELVDALLARRVKWLGNEELGYNLLGGSWSRLR